MVGKFAHLVIKYRAFVLLMSAAIIIAATFGFKKLYFDSSTDIWFLDGDPVLTDYNDLKKKFGSDDYLVVGVQAAAGEKDVLNKETLLAIKKMTTFLEDHAAVNKVRSLSKYQYLYYEDELLNIELAVPDSKTFDYSDAEWNRIREILRGETIVQDLLFTKDLKNTLISARVVEQKNYTGPGNAKTDLSADFRAFLEKEGLSNNSHYKIYLSGSSVISESFFHFSTVDQSISYPLMLTFILIFLFITFRTLSGMFLPLLILIVSCVVTIGLIGYFGWSMNMLNMTLPTMLTVIIIGETIHVLVGFYEYRNKGMNPKEAAEATIKHCFEPCFYTSLTNLLGYLSLASGSLALVITFGIEMSIGVAVSFLFSITTLPALLSYSNLKSKKAEKLVSDGYFVKAIQAMPDKIYPKRKAIITVTLLSLLPLLYLCSRVEVDTNFVRFFKDDAPIKQGLQYFDETYKGSLSLEFTLNSGKEDGVKEPAFLKRALEFQNYLMSLEGNGKALSPINYLMKINQVMNDGNPEYYQVPETRNMVGQYLLLYSNSGPDEDLSDLMTFNGQEMRMSVLFAVAPSKITKQRVETIEKYAAEHFPDLNIKVSGRAVLFNNMDTYTLTGMTSSFALAFITIAICFFVILRSFKFGLIALIPNVLPIIITGAVMGLFNLYLDFATMMVASTTLGIAVDDTIHVMNRFKNAKKENATNREAITVAMQESGVALISTTVVLVVGFSMLMLSSFVPNIYMGLLGCTTIGLAVLCDLYVLPAVIMSLAEGDEPIKSEVENYTGIDKSAMEQDVPPA